MAIDGLWSGAALIALLLRHQSASVRYWIWFAASAKFLLPFAALVTLGGYASWHSVEIVPYRETPLLLEAVGQPFSENA